MIAHETGTDNPIDFPLDGKSEIELTLEREALWELMLYAHEQDITLNQLCENILRDKIEEYKNDITKS